MVNAEGSPIIQYCANKDVLSLMIKNKATGPKKIF
jgi:hypothetical protein